MPTTFSPEMNWVPRAHPMGYRSYKEAQKVCCKINRTLDVLSKRFGPCAMAKPDVLHLKGGEEDENGETSTYSIEVIPVTHFHFSWLESRSGQWDIFESYLETLFALMKRHGLTPSVSRTRKGVTTHFAGGGFHIHCGADLYNTGPDFYKRMERFHRDIAVDFANHPELRWLFADWMSDQAHHLVWRPDTPKKPAGFKTMEDFVFYKLLHGAYAIESRFMKNAKGSYLTFEFRFFRMVENPEEFRLAARFVEAWVRAVRDAMYWDVPPIKFTMNQRKWNARMDPDKAWRAISVFLEGISLDPKDYRVFFERNYLMRLKHGKMD